MLAFPTGSGIWQAFFAETGNCIVKQLGDIPCSLLSDRFVCIRLPVPSIHQGTSWSTFITHNETSKCSKFLSPIKGSVEKNLFTIITSLKNGAKLLKQNKKEITF